MNQKHRFGNLLPIEYIKQMHWVSVRNKIHISKQNRVLMRQYPLAVMGNQIESSKHSNNIRDNPINRKWFQPYYRCLVLYCCVRGGPKKTKTTQNTHIKHQSSSTNNVLLKTMESERIPKILNHAELEFMLADYGQNEICLEKKSIYFVFKELRESGKIFHHK